MKQTKRFEHEWMKFPLIERISEAAGVYLIKMVNTVENKAC